MVDLQPANLARSMDSVGLRASNHWSADVECDQAASRNASTRREYSFDACVHQLFAARAAATPDSLAVEASESSLSYGELDARANRLANRLRALGVGPDVPVGLCLDRSAEFVIGALGILKSGGAYLAMDPSYPAERLTFMLRDARAAVVVTNSSHGEHLVAGAAHVIEIDKPSAGLEFESSIAPSDTVTVGNLAYIIYTSGSTGTPKGVMIEHRSLLNLVFWHQRAFELTESDRATQVASPAFDAAVWELWPNLAAGASVHVVPERVRADAGALRDWLLAKRITVSFMPTPLAEALISLDWPTRADLRLLLTGGDVLSQYPPADLPFTLVNNYGPTEGTVVATSGVVSPRASAQLAPSIGAPIDNVRVYIVDPDLRLCRFGQAGELLLGGDLLGRGYLNRPALTAEKFIRDPFSPDQDSRLYRTGDRVRYRPTGDIEFLGRIDQQVKIRGHRIEPGEIATTLDAYGGVRSSVVIVREDTPGQKVLVAYVVPSTQPPPSTDALRSHLALHLPEYMIPAEFVWLEELPLTVNGKVDLAILPSRRPDKPERSDQPRTELETAMATMICDLLHLDAVAVDENFFVLGGHSLLGAQLIARVRDHFGVEMALRSLFDNPTVSGMATEIERLLLVELDALTDEEAAQLVDELATGS